MAPAMAQSFTVFIIILSLCVHESCLLVKFSLRMLSIALSYTVPDPILEKSSVLTGIIHKGTKVL